MNSALGRATAKAVTNLVEDVNSTSLPESGRSHSKAQAASHQVAAAMVANDVLRETPGKVLAVVDKSTVIVSLGSKQGFKTGDKLKLYETVEIKDDKGNVVFTDEKVAGEVTLDAVQDERSKASSSVEAKSGWVVKLK